jgi:gliding motility-associated-like protein
LVQTTLISDVPLTIVVEPAFTELELGASVQFQTTLSRTNHVQVTWSPAAGLSCSDCLDPLGQPAENTIYVVRASDTLGTCMALDTVEVRVSACKTMFVPNVFAPDDDGTNDFFTVFGGNCVQRVHELQIFDRWGTKVFARTDFSPNEESLGWDGRVGGRLAPPGVYVYWADLELLGGRLMRFSGTVTLVR